MIESYEIAITKMKQLPSTDRRNWTRQAQIHNTFCRHSSWLVLPWHRAYLFYFEQICKELSGNEGFALPYWDWTANPQIPAVFPQKTSSADYPGKTRAKPAIWAEWDKFTAAQQTALAKAQALDAAVRNGNKATIQAAFDDMGKNGCGGCHTPFREPAQQ